MAPKWIGFLIFVWVLAAIVGSISEGEVLLASNSTMGPVQGLMSYGESWAELDSVGGKLIYPVTNTEYFGHVLDLFMLDFPIFGEPGSPWQLIRLIVLAPIIGTIVFGLIILFFSIFERAVS